MNIRIKIIFGTLLLCSSMSFSQKLKVSNTFGADSDSNTDSDLFFSSRQTDPYGNTATVNGFTIGDRLTVDYSSPLISGRGRLGFSFNKTSDDNQSFFFDPSGYVHITPLPQLGFFAGNNAFKKFVISSGYLAAADDYTKYGRMITDTVSTDEDYKRVSENFYIPSQVLIGGITSNWFFGKKDRNYLKLAVSGSLNADQSEENSYSLDSAVNFGNTRLFDFGVTARNLTGGENMKWGVFAGLKSVDNLILNGSFYYNFTSEDYLPEVAVQKKENGKKYYKYKKRKALYAAGISAGYDFKKIGFGLYGDFISGLCSEYLEEGKQYYDAVPYYGQIRMNYQVTEQLSSSLNLKLRSMFKDADSSWITVYPKVKFKLPERAGDISAGLRMDFNLSRYDGLSGISVPLTWTYSFGKDFGK